MWVSRLPYAGHTCWPYNVTRLLSSSYLASIIVHQDSHLLILVQVRHIITLLPTIIIIIAPLFHMQMWVLRMGTIRIPMTAMVTHLHPMTINIAVHGRPLRMFSTGYIYPAPSCYASHWFSLASTTLIIALLIHMSMWVLRIPHAMPTWLTHISGHSHLLGECVILPGLILSSSSHFIKYRSSLIVIVIM